MATSRDGLRPELLREQSRARRDARREPGRVGPRRAAGSPLRRRVAARAEPSAAARRTGAQDRRRTLRSPTRSSGRRSTSRPRCSTARGTRAPSTAGARHLHPRVGVRHDAVPSEPARADLPQHHQPTGGVLPPAASSELKDLLQRLLRRDPSQRLGTRGGAEEVKAHPWFSSVDWALLRWETARRGEARQFDRGRDPRRTRCSPWTRRTDGAMTISRGRETLSKRGQSDERSDSTRPTLARATRRRSFDISFVTSHTISRDAHRRLAGRRLLLANCVSLALTLRLRAAPSPACDPSVRGSRRRSG